MVSDQQQTHLIVEAVMIADHIVSIAGSETVLRLFVSQLD